MRVRALLLWFVIPGLLLVGLYLSFVMLVALVKPAWVPALPAEARIYRETNGASGHRSLLLLLILCAAAGWGWSKVHQSVINPLIGRELPGSTSFSRGTTTVRLPSAAV